MENPRSPSPPSPPAPMQWTVFRDVNGMMIGCLRGKDAGLMFSPSHLGRVSSSRWNGCMPPDNFLRFVNLMVLPEARLMVVPHAGRYGGKTSPLRVAYCEAIATVLNRHGVFPTFEAAP